MGELPLLIHSETASSPGRAPVDCHTGTGTDPVEPVGWEEAVAAVGVVEMAAVAGGPERSLECT